MEVSEKEIENYFISEAKKAGGFTTKFVSPGLAGVPDRIFIPNRSAGRVWFVELKRPGKELRPLQQWVHKMMISFGAICIRIDCKEHIDIFFKQFN